MKKSEITMLRLKEALARLKIGTTKRVKADGRISIKKINEEAGLSQGLIYHYKDFISEARTEIEIYNKGLEKQRFVDGLVSTQNREEKLKNERNNQTRIKENYREQARSFKQMADKLVVENARLAFRIKELEDERRLYMEGKITMIKKK